MMSKLRKKTRRLISFVLTMVMIITNVAANMTVAFASDLKEEALFMIDVDDLALALQDARESGEDFDYDSIELAAKNKSAAEQYERLLKEGSVYQLNVSIDDFSVPYGASLQVFYNEKTDDVIFLFINESDMIINFRVDIGGYATEFVKVRPNTVAEEWEDSGWDDFAADEDDVWEEESTTQANVETGEDVTSNETADQENEAEPAEGQGEGEAETQADSEAEAPTEKETEAQADSVTEAPTEKETEAQTDSVTEATAENETEEQTESETEAQHGVNEISLNETLPIETSAAYENQETSGETEAENIANETTAAPMERISAPADETTAVPTEETSAQSNETTGAPAEETSASEDETTAAPTGETSASTDETTAAPTGETSAPTEEASAPADETTDPSGSESAGPAGGFVSEGGSGLPSDAPISADAPEDDELLPSDDIEVDGTLKGKRYAEVALWDNAANAAAYKVTMRYLKAIFDELDLGVSVEYQIVPEDMAEAVQIHGSSKAYRNTDYTFTAEVEKDYAVTSVTVNEEEAELISSTETEEVTGEEAEEAPATYENVYRIYVPEETEENLVIQIEVEEAKKVIPAAVYTFETEDAIFTVNAPEGAFEEEVELKVTKIEAEDELEKIGERTNAAVEGVVASFLAYDICFLSKETGEEVEPLKPVSVSASLKTALPDDSANENEINAISVLHLPDDGEAEVVAETELEGAGEAAASAEPAETVEISFEAESFSQYVIAYITRAAATLNGVGYSTLQEAIDAVPAAAEEGGDAEDNVIQLRMDIRENIKSENKNYTLEMDGYVIDSVTKDISVYEINGGKVVVNHGILRGGFNVRDKVQSNWRKVADGLGLRIVGGAQVTVTDLTVCENTIDASRNGDPAQYGVGVYVGDKGTSVTMTDCVVSDNYSDWKSLGIGVAVCDGAHLSMTDCTVENNRGGQTSSGSSLYGMIYVENAEFTGDKLTIQNNAFESGDNGSSGSAIRSQGSKVTLTNSEIHGNSDNMSSGGSVVSLETGEVHMESVTISGNESPGSALSLVGMNGDVENVTVSDNTHGVKVADSTASGNVAAVTCNITFENVTIKNNNGMVSSSNSPLTVSTAGSFIMKDSAVTGHERENSGSYGVSAVSLSGTGLKRLENCEIRDNTMRATGALAKSAAVTNEGGTLELVNCTIADNTSSAAGGLSVYSLTTGSGKAVAPGKVTVEGCTFENNTANGTQLTSAGAILVDGLYADDKITVTGTKIQGNTGHSRAGAIYKKGKGTMTVTDSVIKENKLESKTDTTLYETAGVYVESGSFTMESGALYHNEIVKGASLGKDLYVMSSSADVSILAAQEMTEEGVDFSGYRWQKNGASFLDTAIPSKTTGSYTAVSGDLSWEAKIGENTYATLKDAIAEANKSTNTGSEITIELNENLDKIVSKAVSINQRSGALTIKMNGVFLQGDGVTSGGLITLKQGNKTGGNGTVSIEGPGTIWAGGSTSTNNNAIIVNAYAKLHLADVEVMSNTGYGTTVVYGIKNNGEMVIDGDSTAEALKITNYGTLEINRAIKSLVLSASKGATYMGAFSPSKVTMNSPVEHVTLSGLSNFYVIAGENFSTDAITVDSSTWIQAAQFNNASSSVQDTPLIVGNVSEDLIPRITYLQMPTNPYVKFALAESDGTEKWKDDGNKAIIITRSDGELVYLGGSNAKDTNSGTSSGKPVKTFGKAMEVLNAINEGRPAEEKLDTIFIVGQVDVSGKETWESPSDGPKLTLIRNEKTYTGTLVNVTGNLTLKNITIDGGNEKYGATTGYPMIQVNSGTLTIGEGAVLQNNVRTSKGNNIGGGAVDGTGANTQIIMEEGAEVRNNSTLYGGGVAIRNGCTFIMNGGTISGNTAANSGSAKSSGGGVFVSYGAKMVMKGGTISGNTAFNGGGIGVGAEIINYSQNYPSLEMNGGVIDGNVATSQGGGLYFQSQTKGEIRVGSITNNECYGQNSTGGLFGGGGIYVNGGKGGYPDGELHIYDALITGNTAASQGGALSGCPTSTDQIYLDGGVIAGNTGANGKNDVYINGVPIAGMAKGNPKVFLSTMDIKGRAYHWTNVGSKQEVPVSKVDGYVGSTKLNVYTDLEVPEGEAHAVLISGNRSSTSGGAIGTNGKVIIGGETTTEVSVEKKWVDDLGADLPADELPVRIRVKLYRGIKAAGAVDVTSEDDVAWEDVPIAFDELTALGSWKKTFTNLAAKDADGNIYYYMVKEDTEDPELKGKYESTSEWDQTTNTWTITNRRNFGLKLTKQVSVGENSTITEEMAREYEFKFLIYLEHKNGTPYEGTMTATLYENENDANGKEQELIFKLGAAEATLKWGQSIQLNGLSEGMRYKITETESHRADEVKVKFNNFDEWRSVENVTGPVDLGTNDVIFQNTYGDSGALTVKKTVSGAVAEADADKEFTFTVTLTDKAINGVYGDMDFTKGVATFKLKANESRTAVGLPAERIYIVKEEDEDGYRAVYDGEVGSTEAKGIIEKGKTTEVVVNNEAVGALKVSKKIDEAANTFGDKTKAFTFTVKLSDVSGNPVNGTYDVKYTRKNASASLGMTVTVSDSITFTDGKAEFKLRHGDEAMIEGLPAGTDYTVTESDNEGYIVSVSGTTDTEAAGTIEHHETASAEFLNTYETKDITVTKTWSAPEGTAIPESITVTLMQNGVEFRKGVLTAAEGWKYTFDGLAPDDPKGQPYEYTVVETEVSGWTGTVVQNADGSVTINNTYILNEIPVTKIWSAPEGTALPESITVTLMRNGIEYRTAELNAADGWKYTFDGLTSDDENNKPYEYTVVETAVSGWTGTVVQNEDGSVTITNTYTPPTTPPPGDTPDDTPEDTPDDTPEDTPDDTPQDTPRYYPSDTPDNPPPTPINIENEGVPLAAVPPQEMVTILDEDVPLSAVPVTGDEKPIGVAALLALLAAGMMVAFGYAGFKKKEDNK